MLWESEGVFDAVVKRVGVLPSSDLHTRDPADTLKLTTVTVVEFQRALGESPFLCGTPE